MATLPEVVTDARAVPFARDLASHGARPALITPEGEISFRDLAERVDAVARQLGDQRRLVLLEGANRVDALVVYLAALTAGYPLLLVPGGRPTHVESLINAYDPEVVAGSNGEPEWLTERRAGSGDALHPDLSLLLTTSGTTGSAKLVRLSQANLQANAEAIATYLGIRPDDRAATTLPMHYCYGLSVINSHLLRGAALILTDRSVADPDFWQLFRDRQGTSFAGVPYTFDLLDRVGFDTMDLPHLRYVTQAGGRLAPPRVRHYAELGRRHGWDLFVMYGQTEATARMAYLPPDLAAAHPACIGVPIPGGSFRLEPLPDWPEPEVGELVYQGPNVMLGYAESRADLALGRTVGELHTGDLARRTPDGLYELVGRRSRFVKVFGLRIDLQRVEAVLERRGLVGCCAGGDGELVVAIESGPDVETVRRQVAAECGLPVRAVRVVPVPAIPRLPSGKPDYPAVRALAHPTPPRADQGLNTHELIDDHVPFSLIDAEREDLCRLYAEVLGRPEVTRDDSFVSLGGDSLSYVELSVRLERALGRLPEHWHTTPIRELMAIRDPTPVRDPAAAPRRRRWWGAATLDTSVALRAIAIVLIVGTHAALFPISGGAHLLLGVAGFNFARFYLTPAPHRERLRHIGRGIGRVALVSMTFIGLVFLFTDGYSLANVFLLHYVFGPEDAYRGWHFWFIETLVYTQLAMLLMLALPAVDRLERRFPFGLPMGLVGLGLVTRYELVPGPELATPLVVFWLFALGWAAAKADTVWQRLLVTVAIVVTLPGFFENPYRVALIIAGMVLLVWVWRVPGIRPLNRLVGLLAGASLFIYLTHWQVYPHLFHFSPVLATVASLVAGVGYALVVTKLVAWLHRRVARPRPVRLASPG